MVHKVFLSFLLVLLAGPGCPAETEVVFPAESWQRKSPVELGLAESALVDLGKNLGGRGCVIKDGYVVHEWGDQCERSDWLSSAKPVLSTLLFFAIEEGKVKGVDQPIADFGWDLVPKDQTITFRHLGAMTSGYARPEKPGEAWAYNDYAINLYQMTLFDKVFKGEPKSVAEHPNRLGALGLEDGLEFRESNRRLSASVRDFARIAWFWLNRGRWREKQVLPEDYFEDYMRPQIPVDLPHTESAETNDYLGIGSFGGGSDHFTKFGAGIYGFNWWFNEKGRLHTDAVTWPDAPPDAIMSIGAGGNCTILLPSENLAVVCAKGDWGKLEAGEEKSRMNRHFRTIAGVLGQKGKLVENGEE
jgi:CubicO group peptidase (beta-lactamase class C family)